MRWKEASFRAKITTKSKLLSLIQREPKNISLKKMQKKQYLLQLHKESQKKFRMTLVSKDLNFLKRRNRKNKNSKKGYGKMIKILLRPKQRNLKMHLLIWPNFKTKNQKGKISRRRNLLHLRKIRIKLHNKNLRIKVQSLKSNRSKKKNPNQKSLKRKKRLIQHPE